MRLRVAMVLAFLVLLIGVASAVKTVSPNYVEITSPVGFENNVTSAIAFADIPKDGLVLWLPFDEGWGYVAHDWSGLGNDGIGYNNTTKQINWTVGVQGGAVKLDGVDDYVEVPDSGSLNILSNGITIAVWVYPTKSDIAQQIVYKVGTSNAHYRLFIRSYNVWGFSFKGDLDTLEGSGSDVEFNKWQFVVATYDYATKTARFYCNGELVTEIVKDVGTIDTTGNSLHIGSGYGTYYFNGSIDNVMIYNRALSDEEIKKIYEATKPKYDINDGLVLYLPFDEMSGTVAHDLSGNGNDGTGYINVTAGTLGINWTAGIYGGAWKGDGVDDRVQVSHSDELNTENGTVAVWVNFQRLASEAGFYQGIIHKTNQWWLRIDIDDRFALYLHVAGSWAGSAKSTTVVEKNKWYFVVGTWEYDAVNDVTIWKIYVNGQLEGERQATGKIDFTTNPVYIGWSDFSKAIIDEVRIYNRALSDEEIKYLYELGKSKLHLEKGLVLHLTFDEGVGNVTYNYAMTNITINSGTFYGNLTANWTTGMIGKAIEFDGVDDYVEIPDSESLHFNGSDSFTITGWFKLNILPSEKGSNEVIICKTFDFLVRTDALTDKLHFWVYDGTDWEPRVSTITVPQTNKWYFFTAVYNAGTLKIYLNGKLENTQTNTKAEATTRPVIIGSWGGESNYFEGLIDDVRIYNRALSPEEIKALYLLTKNKYDSEFTIVNYTVTVTPTGSNDLKITLNPENELTDIHKLVFLPAAAAHSYELISTDIDDYGNKVQVVETAEASPTFTINIPDLSAAPDGVALAVWDWMGTLRFVADSSIYSTVRVTWGIFDWILTDFTEMFIHRNNELKPGDIFEFPDVQLTLVASGYISSTHPIKKTDRGLVISESEFAAEPSAEATIYLTEFNPDKIREGTTDLLVNFTVDTEYHDQNITFVITNLPPNVNFTVYKDGVEYMTVRTNETGVLTFTDNKFSPTTFVIKAEVVPAPLVAPPTPELPDLSAAVRYVSYALAGILTFLTILLVVRKVKGAS